MATFWISRLRVVGPKVVSAEVEFGQHLNVISGASDTGKSYILACINYMFGAEEPPKSIRQDRGYETLLLEIKTSNNEVFVLQRSLKQGKDFLLYNQTIDEWKGSGGKYLRWKHTGGSTDTVSQFLLGLCGLGDVTISTSKTKTRPLSFRDVARFCLISETDIIEEESPVFPSRQLIKKTADKSVFDFLISGEDSGSAIQAPDPKVRKADWKARFDVYSQMIGEVEVAISKTAETARAELTSLNEDIDRVTSVIADNSNAIALEQRLRNQDWKEWHAARSRRDVLDQLLVRFDLLKNHYQSDIERLEFLTEADHYLSQVAGGSHCPICGSTIEGHSSKSHDDGREVEIKDAARGEAAKLESLLIDLGSTVSELQSEYSQLESAIQEFQNRINGRDQKILGELSPRMQVAKEQLDLLLEKRKEASSNLSAHERLKALSDQRDLLGPEPKQSRSKSTSIESTGASIARRQFLNKLQSVLLAWKYSPVDVAEFNEKMELIVAGETRKSHGKGIRAILQSAFTITLMMHSLERHPGLIVLDSPLTSFREADEYEVDRDVQRGFFEYLVGFKKGQVIVLENKDPDQDLISKMRYVHFAGESGSGRKGFYPV